MSTYRLDRVFTPASVALIGASPRVDGLGNAVLRNLRAGGFGGQIALINPRYDTIDGEPCRPDLTSLDFVPDLVVITAPARLWPRIVEAAGRKGVSAAIIVAAENDRGPDSYGARAARIARRHGLRLIGPNSFGVMVPRIGLNAGIAAAAPVAGDLALVTQSGAIAAGMLEWGARRNLGFSAIVSVGDKRDVDIGDLLDHFARDHQTRAILMHVETLTMPRKFMSAARAAARVKPVVIVKPRHGTPRQASPATHTAALARTEHVHEAAFRRCGLLPVESLDELFDAAETLGRQKPFDGRKLAILTNGRGLGALAMDALEAEGGEAARLHESGACAPVDLGGGAGAQAYEQALAKLLADPGVDAVLTLNLPNALADTDAAARAVAEAVTADRRRGFRRKPVFAVWPGAGPQSMKRFEEVGISCFASESEAVRGFMHLVRYREGLHQLMQTPRTLAPQSPPDRDRARAIIEGVLAGGRRWLDPIEAMELLAAYGISTTPTRRAGDPEEAARIAAPILDAGGTVAVKILSQDIPHKSDVGGVELDLTSVDAVRRAAGAILERAREKRPEARIAGLSVQPMMRRPKARELICGIADDPTFGPVIVFGRGGTAVEQIDDKALALPPLDANLAADLIGRTRVSRILAAYRDVPAADLQAVQEVLVALSQMAADLPELRELDVNPLLADGQGVIAVDARIAVAPVPEGLRRGSGHLRLAIRPYPEEWETPFTTRDGRDVLIRPVRPEDEELFKAFFAKVTTDDLRLRFFAPVRDFSHAFIARLIQIDYARAIAFTAVDRESGEMLGAVRLHADADMETGEYAILLRSDLKGIGLGWRLMRMIIAWAEAEGLSVIEGQVLRENTTMLDMCRKLGFALRADPDDPDLRIVRLAVTEGAARTRE
ncbi:MAG: bifunctional acetate--CoA ligase family protein/GNAT family N-acetyltransferase [Salinarimonas sp.]|nr:bifunctional acetate--CoA ligase family protein/GNAT family N-acetyltransferase [Salinarimonas sp.]